MPIYEYQCEACDEPFEVFVRSISKKVEAVCPNCGSERVTKSVSGFAARVAGAAPSTSSVDCGPSF